MSINIFPVITKFDDIGEKYPLDLSSRPYRLGSTNPSHVRRGFANPPRATGNREQGAAGVSRIDKSMGKRGSDLPIQTERWLLPKQTYPTALRHERHRQSR
ncbi:hypothetical protein QUF80_01605 [Desulfococcaceae bacterium HSG8]|nr:hypothetical protein [Desulfococcaceae bacterium HSG8]